MTGKELFIFRDVNFKLEDEGPSVNRLANQEWDMEILSRSLSLSLSLSLCLYIDVRLEVCLGSMQLSLQS